MAKGIAGTAEALREKWRKGEPVFGLWAAIPDGFSAEVCCLPGVDYICADQQHGIIDYADMVRMLRAIEGRGSAVPITRVPANSSWLIGKALDAGAEGVVVPLVSTAAEAAAAVAACRYPPDGSRSYGPARPSVLKGSRDPAVLQKVLCFVMIETAEGLENLDAIAQTPGLDGIYIGPSDLALGLGLPPILEKEEPRHAAAIERILKSCQAHGIVPGMHCTTGAAARAYAERGFRLVTFARDASLLIAGVERELQAIRR